MILLPKDGKWPGVCAIKNIDRLTLRALLTKGSFLTLVQAIAPGECGRLKADSSQTVVHGSEF